MHIFGCIGMEIRNEERKEGELCGFVGEFRNLGDAGRKRIRLRLAMARQARLRLAPAFAKLRRGKMARQGAFRQNELNGMNF